jgi:aspartyl-tRNA(Asn)/glutamyl-tRNA(Gln) amidotransferase subunit A
LKPTLGRVSTQGVLPLSWTLDHVGPLASCVDDLKILFDVIRRDKPANRDHEECRRLRLATIPYFQERIHPDVQKAVTAAIDTFRSDGHKVTEIELAGLKEAIDASDVISRSEAVTVHHESLTQWPQYYDPRVRERLSTGYELSARDLVQAQRLRAELIRSFKRVFRRIDCIVAPALPVVAPPIGTTSIRFGPDSESIVYCFVRLMAIQNMAGLPALSIPCGFSADDMPIGMQLIGGRGSDDLLLTLGSRFQELTSWHQRVPNAVATAERER